MDIGPECAVYADRHTECGKACESESGCLGLTRGMITTPRKFHRIEVNSNLPALGGREAMLDEAPFHFCFVHSQATTVDRDA